MFSDSSMSTRFASTTRVDLILLVLNVLGAVLYLWRASLSWVISQEKGLNSTTGEPFIWAVAVLPIFVLFLLLNVSWGVFVLRRRQWSSGRLWLLAALVWLIAAGIDFAHH